MRELQRASARHRTFAVAALAEMQAHFRQHPPKFKPPTEYDEWLRKSIAAERQKRPKPCPHEHQRFNGDTWRCVHCGKILEDRTIGGQN